VLLISIVQGLQLILPTFHPLYLVEQDQAFPAAEIAPHERLVFSAEKLAEMLENQILFAIGKSCFLRDAPLRFRSAKRV
jgi:hypothetical protein